MQGMYYFANVSLGTPAQKLRLQIDTGSSDMWVHSVGIPECQGPGSINCSCSGTFDTNASSTYTYLNSDFNIWYQDSHNSHGDYALETVSIGGQQLNHVQFGIGYNTVSRLGILGIGYRSDEAIPDNRMFYPNLPELMVDQGLIQSNAYSLWLDDIESSTGTILFGGVDTHKFHGMLQTLPVIPSAGVYEKVSIVMSGVGLSTKGRRQFSRKDLSAVAMLDAGSTLIQLPNNLFDAILQGLDMPYEMLGRAAIIDCSLAESPALVDFTFSSATIVVPMNELVAQAVTNDGEELTNDDGSPKCVFGIMPSNTELVLLGDTFLRSAYVVYDLANNQVSLAQTDFNATSSHLVEIGKGKGWIPNGSSAANSAQASTTGT
ncbi:MAG: hypothetical protein LQ345_003675 [Seirophora villosa]|nr:MAG: hypothetical protein LQ345_003675 [Seirophora villosa]